MYWMTLWVILVIQVTYSISWCVLLLWVWQCTMAVCQCHWGLILSYYWPRTTKHFLKEIWFSIRPPLRINYLLTADRSSLSWMSAWKCSCFKSKYQKHNCSFYTVNIHTVNFQKSKKVPASKLVDLWWFSRN